MDPSESAADPRNMPGTDIRHDSTEGESSLIRDFPKRYSWIAFFVIFIFSMIYAAAVNIQIYVFDSMYYWTKADPVFENGFNLLLFPNTFRGYLFPVLVGIFKMLFHGVLGWRIIAALSSGFTFAFSLPYVISGRRINSYKEVLRVVLSFIFFMWIWGDFMQYPLSDFCAAAFLLAGVALLKSMITGRFSLNTWLTGTGCGVMLYAAYNTRAAFLYGALFSVIVFCIWNRKHLKYVLFVFLAVLAGGFLIALPQCLINQQYAGAFSPKVYTEAYTGGDKNLQTVQVLLGIQGDRRETYSGNDQSHYPEGAVIFNDPVGYEILRRRNLSIDRFSVFTVFKLIREFPLDMMGIYIRNLISLMTPMYRQIYINNLYQDKGLWTSVSVVIWIIAGFGVLEQLRRKKSLSNSFWIFAICLPSFLQLFGNPEIRFFLPVYLLCYTYVFVTIDYKEAFVSLKGDWIRVVICFMVIFMLWMTVFGNIVSNSQFRTFIIHDSLAGQGFVDK